MKYLNLTEKQIISIAKTQGEFHLNWNYRVDNARGVADKLVRKGILKRTRRNRGLDVWELSKAYKQFCLSPNPKSYEEFKRCNQIK